jgi:hypothetical protein
VNADGSINVFWLLVGIGLFVGFGVFMRWYDRRRVVLCGSDSEGGSRMDGAVSALTPRELLVRKLFALGAAPRSEIEEVIREYRDAMLTTLADDMRFSAAVTLAATGHDPESSCIHDGILLAAEYLDEIRQKDQKEEDHVH